MPTFSEAQQAMIEYLGSEEFKTREDAEDTVPHVKFLQKLCAHGFITNDSQQGSKDDRYNYVERAYVFGFMKPSTTEKVMAALCEQRSDKLFFKINVAKCTDKRYERIPLTLDGGKAFTTSSTFISKQDFDFQKANAGLNKNETVDYVACFDPVWGRSANSRNGLYHDLFHALA